MAQLTLKVIKVDHEGIGRVAGQGQKKVRPVKACNLGGNLLGDCATVLPVDGCSQPHLPAKTSRLIVHDREHFVRHLYGYGCHGMFSERGGRLIKHHGVETLSLKAVRDARGLNDDSQRLSRSRIQTVKLNYQSDTDSCTSIDLCDRPSVDSREISEGVVLDYDAEERLVGIDVDNAGNKIELQKILLSKLLGKVETEAA